MLLNNVVAKPLSYGRRSPWSRHSKRAARESLWVTQVRRLAIYTLA